MITGICTGAFLSSFTLGYNQVKPMSVWNFGITLMMGGEIGHAVSDVVESTQFSRREKAMHSVRDITGGILSGLALSDAARLLCPDYSIGRSLVITCAGAMVAYLNEDSRGSLINRAARTAIIAGSIFTVASFGNTLAASF